MFEKENEKIDEILGEIDRKNEENEANLLKESMKKKKKRVPSREITAVVALMLFIISVFYNYDRYSKSNKPLEISDEEKMESIKNYLYLVSQKIEGYKEENKRLPLTMEEIMIEDSFTTYKTIQDTLYEIECRYENLTLKYVSSEDPEELLTDKMIKTLNREEK
ncbi:MAG: hypothetical protein PHW02_00080 [bacterium]|nr:hypothetical protein [bacterium]